MASAILLEGREKSASLRSISSCRTAARRIFVHASTPEQARIMRLNKGQRVIVGVVAGRKGPEAASLQGVY